jgi:hypothetical protein
MKSSLPLLSPITLGEKRNRQHMRRQANFSNIFEALTCGAVDDALIGEL